MKRRMAAALLVMMMLGANGALSARYAVAEDPVTLIPAAVADDVTGGSWWGCVGFLSTVAAAAASGGIGGGIVGALAALGLSVATVCECAPYFDDVIGTDFQGMCLAS